MSTLFSCSGLAGFFPLHPMTVTEAERLKVQTTDLAAGAEGEGVQEEEPKQQSAWGWEPDAFCGSPFWKYEGLNHTRVISGVEWILFLCYTCIFMLCFRTMPCKIRLPLLRDLIKMVQYDPTDVITTVLLNVWLETWYLVGFLPVYLDMGTRQAKQKWGLHSLELYLYILLAVIDLSQKISWSIM